MIQGHTVHEFSLIYFRIDRLLNIFHKTIIQRYYYYYYPKLLYMTYFNRNCFRKRPSYAVLIHHYFPKLEYLEFYFGCESILNSVLISNSFLCSKFLSFSGNQLNLIAKDENFYLFFTHRPT